MSFQVVEHITSLEEKKLSLYRTRSEVQLLRYHEPDPGYFLAESPNVIARAIAAGYEVESFLIEESQLSHAEELLKQYSCNQQCDKRTMTTSYIQQNCRAQSERKQDQDAACDKEKAYGNTHILHEGLSEVPIYIADKELLDQITGFHLTRGVLALMRRRICPDALTLAKNMHRIAILEDVMNPTNLGAIFRSAAALGVEGVFLTGGCTDPLYRRAARVSMGTVFQVPWTWLPENGIQLLKDNGFSLCAMALREDSLTPDAPELKSCDKLGIVLGTEGEGLKEETIAACDYTVCIPMTNGVDSLNVAAASAVAFWELCRK